jgi:hypothetical protein
MIEGRRETGLRSLAVAGVLLLGAGSHCSAACVNPPPPPLPGQAEVRPIYQGSSEAPVAALLLLPEPVTYVTGPGAPEGNDHVERLEEGEQVTLSRDWKHLVRSRFAPGKTSIEFGQRTVELRGRAGLALDSDGRTIVTWTQRDEDELTDQDERDHELSIHDSAGEVLHRAPIAYPEWVDVAPRGERIALAQPGETLVLAREGEVIGRYPAARRGALSAEGTWLALETPGASPRFVMVRVGRDTAAFDVTEPAVALAFDTGSTRLARVTQRRLQLYRLGEDEVEPVSERAPPEGFAWRSAAFSGEGRLAAGRIQIVARPQRHPADPPEPDTPGQAFLAVDVFPTLTGPDAKPISAVWEVPDWNNRAPEVAFGPSGLFAVSWPSAFEVEL